MNNFFFKYIAPFYPALKNILALSVGFPTPEKIETILQHYSLASNFYLLGCFQQDILVGIVGFQCSEAAIIINHLAVHESYQKRGVGRQLIEELVKQKLPLTVSAETDGDTVDFYKKCGFFCTEHSTKYGLRYICQLNKKIKWTSIKICI